VDAGGSQHRTGPGDGQGPAPRGSSRQDQAAEADILRGRTGQAADQELQRWPARAGEGQHWLSDNLRPCTAPAPPARQDLTGKTNAKVAAFF